MSAVDLKGQQLRSGCCALVLQGVMPRQLQQLLSWLQQRQQKDSSHTSLTQAVQQRSPTTFSDLPRELLVHVLRRVELPLRLGPCSLVCSSWSAAAPAAASSVSVRMHGFSSDGYESGDQWELEGEAAAEVVTSSDSIRDLEHWLAAHAAHLTQLTVKAATVEASSSPVALSTLQLPFVQLQRLRRLTCCNAQLQELQLSSLLSENDDHTAGLCQQQQLQYQAHQEDFMADTAQQPLHSTATAAHPRTGSSSSSSDTTVVLQPSLSSLTNLTALRLRGVKYCCSGGLAALSALTGLQQLQLVNSADYDYEQQQQQRQVCYLPSFKQLTCLQLDVCLLPKDAVGVFSGLQRLQELTLQGYLEVRLDALQGLPPSITELQLFVQMQEPFSISTVPALAQLSALRQLVVCDPFERAQQEGGVGGDIHLEFLSSMPSTAQLRGVILEGNMRSDMLPSLLGVMPRLTSLMCLCLSSVDRNDNMPRPVHDVARYSALLPPALHLTSFSMTARSACLLPAGCGVHVFGGQQQLLQLKVLELGPLQLSYHNGPNGLEQFIYFSGEEHGGCEVPVACFGPGDVERLVCCCPGLEQLWLPGLVQAGVDVSALLRLTALTGLFIGGEVWDDSVAVRVLAEMSGLRQLELCDAPGFTDQGLLALAALTGLTKLCVLCCGLSVALPTYLNGRESTVEDEEAGCYMLWAEDQLPAVWQQLLVQLCDFSDVEACRQQANERLITQLAGLPAASPTQPHEAPGAAESAPEPTSCQPGLPSRLCPSAVTAQPLALGCWWHHIISLVDDQLVQVVALLVLVLVVGVADSAVGYGTTEEEVLCRGEYAAHSVGQLELLAPFALPATTLLARGVLRAAGRWQSCKRVFLALECVAVVLNSSTGLLYTGVLCRPLPDASQWFQ